MGTRSSKYINHFSRRMTGFFFKAWKINWYKPGNSSFWFKTLINQKQAMKTRQENLKAGVQIPPVTIFSITNRCNLNCKGCYAHSQDRDTNRELSSEKITKLFSEISEAGSSVIVIAGGEPLLRKEVLEAAASNKKTLFPVFTNGVLLNNGRLDLFKSNRNLIPVLSIEGNRLETDTRRGSGLHQLVKETAKNLKNKNVFYGLSLTLTRNNFDEVMTPSYINEFFKDGCRLFFYVEYVPEGESDKNYCLTDEQKNRLKTRLANLKIIFPSVFLALPGDEKQFGGCMAAGRGFIHISSTGDLEPCPFVPYSDVNLNDMSFKEALKSKFLSSIRKQHHELKESEGGCVLSENSEWVTKQLNTTASKKEIEAIPEFAEIIT